MLQIPSKHQQAPPAARGEVNETFRQEATLNTELPKNWIYCGGKGEFLTQTQPWSKEMLDVEWNGSGVRGVPAES